MSGHIKNYYAIIPNLKQRKIKIKHVFFFPKRQKYDVAFSLRDALKIAHKSTVKAEKSLARWKTFILVYVHTTTFFYIRNCLYMKLNNNIRSFLYSSFNFLFDVSSEKHNGQKLSGLSL